MIGRQLAHFTVTAKLGEGGMGEVYRAEDSRLGREVAIKVLPEAFVAEPERLGRFEREAKVLASLSHPNIAGIHEIGEAEGVHFLVMELAAGETLGERLGRGPIPVDEAVAVGLQIAKGLEAAHERGVIHRDLKPGNVMVDAKGGVKILDFGLAKALDPHPSSGPGAPTATALAHSPTLTYQATMAGTLLGTAAYMSPEQARGEPADRRADIWSFGVVLWEMLTGRRLFEGRTVSDTLAGILRDEIDVSALPPTCPASLRRLVGRCLERDPDRRLHDIADARIVLQDVADGVEELPVAEAPSDGTPRRRRSEVAAWLLAAIFLLAALAAAWLAMRGRTEATSPRPVSAHLLPPEGTAYEFGDKYIGSIALSPDGSRLAISALSTEDRSRLLYVRPLASMSAIPLPGTEGATFPFWSPDGRFIAFFAGGKLKKVEASGGAVLTLCDAPDGRGGAWNRDGVIVFTPSTQDPLYQVSAGGGPPTAITELDASGRLETSHRFPFFLPDGRHYAFIAGGVNMTGTGRTFGLWVASLDTPGRQLIMTTGSRAAFANGHLLFVRDGILMAQRFDAESAALEGEPFPVAEGVFYNPQNQGAAFTVDHRGTLVYYPSDLSQLRLVSVDRDGEEVSSIGDPGAFDWIRLSPDGRRVAATLSESSDPDLWTFDVESGAKVRLTFNPRPDSNPVWSPDGTRIAYALERDDTNQADIAVRSAGGGGEAEILLETSASEVPWDWSPDGRYITYNRTTEAGQDIWVLPLDGGEPFPLVEGSANEGWGYFSPDGRWVAYISNEAGDWQLFATPFPDGGGRWQLTSDMEGASWILDWLDDGIYEITNDQMLAVLEVEPSADSIRAGRRQRLMPIDSEITWAVNADGTRFVLGRPLAGRLDPPLVLVTDWLASRR